MLRWIKSKTVWAAIGVAALGVADLIAGDHASAAQRGLEFLAIIGVRHAIWKAADASGS